VHLVERRVATQGADRMTASLRKWIARLSWGDGSGIPNRALH
jgi:hypothetical protein